MEERSLTALVSAFARWYHAKRYDTPVYNDSLAGALLTAREKEDIAANMQAGIQFFCPGFTGTAEEALRWIVDKQLSLTPLGRAAFCEESLRTAARTGTRQYCILAAGYDTFAYRQPEWAYPLTIFELDHPATARDKRKRLDAAGIGVPSNTHLIDADLTHPGWSEKLVTHPAFDRSRATLCSLLGISYYLSREDFEQVTAALAKHLPEGSSLLFDYPDQDSLTSRAGTRAQKQAALASGANEAMRASYAYADLEAMLARHGLLIYEHLSPEEITAAYFGAHNAANPGHEITALDNVHYCLAVKK